MRILITGGAGFVGSNLALALTAKHPGWHITAFDNLKRRGSELNLPRLRAAGVSFVHGDIRLPEELDAIEGGFDLLIEASAEPSVLAGLRPGESPLYAIHTNLTGTVNCLEWARRRGAQVLFFSTSRVYSVKALRELPLKEEETRFELDGRLPAGLSSAGITEEFSTGGQRSLYGTTKLGSEHLIEEYATSFGVKALINRFSVICGPWQWGKADQGVFSLWVARHAFHSSKKPGKLSYTGFGGKGQQVRDLLHPADLCDLVLKQLDRPQLWDGRLYNAGGGMGNSVSLREMTALCQAATGHELQIGSVAESAGVDVPYFVTDYARAGVDFGWKPRHSLKDIVGDISEWLKANREQLEPLFT